MIIKILGNKDELAYQSAAQLVKSKGHHIWDDTCYYADLAIAPLLNEKVSNEELRDSVFGTLIFHPSPLPYGRGASAIKYAYKRNEPITAATWFWADKGIDTGDICEQEIVKIDYAVRPREFYEREMTPAMLRTLECALDSLAEKRVRRIPQVHKYATFDKRI